VISPLRGSGCKSDLIAIITNIVTALDIVNLSILRVRAVTLRMDYQPKFTTGNKKASLWIDC
jgi:hypothetical protein